MTCIHLVDPRSLAPSLFFGMSITQATQVLARARESGASQPTQQLWAAQKIIQSCIHPQTGEVIWQPFRMSGFVIYSMPIVVGMIMPSPSLYSTIGWQWLNQSHNAAVNYANRNTSAATTNTEIFTGYLAAVTTSVTLCLGLQRLPFIPLSMMRFCALPAVAAGNVANCFAMRHKELDAGIEVKDKHGQTIGVSSVAAWQAVTDTAFTRCVLPMPNLFIGKCLGEL